MRYLIQGAHPRLRGADWWAGPFHFQNPGSSPLTRGGHWLFRELRNAGGLIPAYAGRTHAPVPA
ncbi:hypothetical protein HMPREF0308_0798 [Corynebacterium striatum ATCC 6940]|nr:hypothetical protein HMPREF0308_0798 [Corynebacterium striatum ATCC 6940]